MSYLWTFSDGTASTEQEPSPVMTYGGDHGDRPDHYRCAGLHGFCDIVLPLRFAGGSYGHYHAERVPPNGDGDNDLFGPIAMPTSVAACG
ncbi:MAG: hypothetical protein IPO12_17000 [Flavobacteriales bacterium]|nr:hypothetical protein [Flavobacteriales bacterium]